MPIELMDYPKANIRMVVETKWEREWRSRSASKEPETTAWIDEYVQDGDVFWDIGANVGTYGLMAASRGAHVIAVEPETANIKRLDENIKLNSTLDMTILWTAVSDEESDGVEMAVTYGKAGAANNHLGVKGENTQTIEVTTLNLIAAHSTMVQPTHIKIDVDGHELQVVRGGIETLQACQTVMIEIDHDKEALDEIRAVFEGFDEEVFYRSGNTFNHRFVRSTDDA